LEFDGIEADRSMLLGLTLVDYVLIERLELNLQPGFSVLTGETGAGKSILLDALGLVLGERADGTMIRAGAARAEVGAEFSLAGMPELQSWLAEAGLEGAGDELLLRRTVEAGGRSRAFINGRPATLQQLRELGGRLVDIHGQHAHYSLMQSGVQRDLLDAYGGCAPLAERTADAYRVWREAARRRLEAQQRAEADAGERERLAWVVDELTALDFRPEQWQALQETHRRLSHAAELLGGAQGLIELLDGEGDGIISRLRLAKARLDELAAYDPRLADCGQMLEDGLIQTQEARRELSRYAERVELDPEALAAAEARIAQVMAVARKLRCGPEALPAVLQDARARLAELAEAADAEGLARAEAEALTAYEASAQALSACRHQAAEALAVAVTEAMQRLAMQGGRFRVELTPCAPEAGGRETVSFWVAPHPGQDLRPLARTASGGELSRLGLALQTVLSGRSGARTLIFDEVDAGIGGGVAEVVGRLLAGIARDRQVLCVTHLPQVAARATHHWRVSKEEVDGRTLSRVRHLDPDERVEEIARMLGGVEVTDITRRHAREMLGLEPAEGLGRADAPGGGQGRRAAVKKADRV
jgi:DNA repair protein RecN (Recombination protein N)